MWEDCDDVLERGIYIDKSKWNVVGFLKNGLSIL